MLSSSRSGPVQLAASCHVTWVMRRSPFLFLSIPFVIRSSIFRSSCNGRLSCVMVPHMPLPCPPPYASDEFHLTVFLRRAQEQAWSAGHPFCPGPCTFFCFSFRAFLCRKRRRFFFFASISGFPRANAEKGVRIGIWMGIGNEMISMG